MARLLNTSEGIARQIDADTVELLETSYAELGEALGDLAALANAPLRASKAIADLTIRSPVQSPNRYFIIGLNYQSHVDETGLKRGADPIYGITAYECVCDPGADVQIPADYPSQVDFEGEIGVVIGRRAESVPEDEAWSYVAGLTPLNDVSARDVQRSRMKEGGNFADAKSFPTFKPTGPTLVTVDELKLPLDVPLKTIVNGEVRQESDASYMIHNIPELVAYISAREPLMPGDILATGTPEGVGHVDGRFLKPGDTVEIQIADWLPLVNRLV